MIKFGIKANFDLNVNSRNSQFTKATKVPCTLVVSGKTFKEAVTALLKSVGEGIVDKNIPPSAIDDLLHCKKFGVVMYYENKGFAGVLKESEENLSWRQLSSLNFSYKA